MKKFKIISIPIFISLFFVLSGCAEESSSELSLITPASDEAKISNEVNALSVYHWWTSEGERSAINALSDVFVQEYPDTAAMITPVLGGGGMEMIEKIKPMILASQAPDSFVAHPGYEILPYANDGLLQSVEDIWRSEDLENHIPSAVQEMSKINGRYYAIPLDIHRNNLVWFNKQLIDKNDINVSTLTDWDSFFATCDKLRAAGVQYPIQMARAWTATFAFHTILLSQGVDLYQDYINGKIVSENDPRLKNTLDVFKKYMSYVNPDHADISWNEATNRIIKGEGAFNIMGDWANGEFKLIGMKFNEDYGVFSVPGTDGLHLLVVDAFVRPEGALHPTSSSSWLKTVASREGQDAFNPKKGSISPRDDSDKSVYDDYQKSAIDYFHNSRLIVDTGTALPYEFRNEINNLIAEFTVNQDVDVTVKKITDLTRDLADKYLITWTLD